MAVGKKSAEEVSEEKSEVAARKQEIGQRLLRARKQLGKTRADWIAQYKIGASRISQWETGVTMPDLFILMQICEDYDISLDYLLRGKRRRVRVAASSSRTNTSES